MYTCACITQTGCIVHDRMEYIYEVESYCGDVMAETYCAGGRTPSRNEGCETRLIIYTWNIAVFPLELRQKVKYIDRRAWFALFLGEYIIFYFFLSNYTRNYFISKIKYSNSHQYNVSFEISNSRRP